MRDLMCSEFFRFNVFFLLITYFSRKTKKKEKSWCLWDFIKISDTLCECLPAKQPPVKCLFNYIMNLCFRFSEKYATNVMLVIILSACDAPKMKNMMSLRRDREKNTDSHGGMVCFTILVLIFKVNSVGRSNLAQEIQHEMKMHIL